MNEHHPDTFSIPSAEEREALVASDCVKLVFSIAVEDPDADDGFTINGERMWVRIEGSYGPYLWGKLANNPLDGQEYGLAHGAEIVFLPEHVIDIVDAEQQAKDEAAHWARQRKPDKAKKAKKQDDDLANLRPVHRAHARGTD